MGEELRGWGGVGQGGAEGGRVDVHLARGERDADEEDLGRGGEEME